MRVLFVTNGHGEAAIAERIAVELRTSGGRCADRPSRPRRRHAVARSARRRSAREHAERRPHRDVQPAQHRARPARGAARTDGGAAALSPPLAGCVRRGRRGGRRVCARDGAALAKPTVFVGSAKSVAVAPYGPSRNDTSRRARACFVRDEATAQSLREDIPGVEVANAIVDLFATADDPAAQRAVRRIRAGAGLVSREPRERVRRRCVSA